MADLTELQATFFDLEEKLALLESSEEKAKAIKEHIGKVEELQNRIPNFPDGLEWMNIDTPLSLETNLHGKIVVLDFFTYCCINCMHVLPDLEKLEEIYSIEDGVVIVGVHSSKFDTEKISANIRSAILRYSITHPVVNDDNAVLWEKLQIQCWPTFVVVGPSGQLLNIYIGEGHRKKLIQFVSEALKYYSQKQEISNHALKIRLERDKEEEKLLSFPGKICCSGDGETLALTDTGHHRVIVLDKAGNVKHCFGGKSKGFKDGGAKECRFNSPQGIVFYDQNTLFVADTDNHAIRKICLSTETVCTVVGLGHQGNDKEGGKQGVEQEISSPWDVVSGHSPGSDMDDVLFIAMAGTHQIWAYFLQDVTWYKKKEYKAGICVRFAGNGNEENRNNSYPDKAAFAQPSGLALSTHPDLNTMYVADSESSSIRAIQMKDGAVKAFVGAERDPKNLFAYGNKDGIGVDAKLKHPLAVALVTENEGPLLIADTYNSQIKKVDIKTKSCTTFGGDGESYPVNIKLSEPSGLCVDRRNQLLYVTDTNNHTVRVINLQDNTHKELNVQFKSDKNPIKKATKKSDMLRNLPVMTSPEFSVCPDVCLSVLIDIVLPQGSHINEEAPSTWTMYTGGEGEEDLDLIEKGSFLDAIYQSEKFIIKDLKISKYTCGKWTLYVKCKVFYCEQDNTCRMYEAAVQQDFTVNSNSGNNTETLKFKLVI